MLEDNVVLNNKTVFVTGVAGFIGSNLAKRLLKEFEGVKVVGIDNMNDYYDVSMKEWRLKELSSNPSFTFVKGSIADKDTVTNICNTYQHSVVVNVAGKEGPRYAIRNPDGDRGGNLIGF